MAMSLTPQSRRNPFGRDATTNLSEEHLAQKAGQGSRYGVMLMRINRITVTKRQDRPNNAGVSNFFC